MINVWYQDSLPESTTRLAINLLQSVKNSSLNSHVAVCRVWRVHSRQRSASTSAVRTQIAMANRAEEGEGMPKNWQSPSEAHCPVMSRNHVLTFACHEHSNASCWIMMFLFHKWLWLWIKQMKQSIWRRLHHIFIYIFYEFMWVYVDLMSLMSQAALLDPSKVLLLRHHRTARPRQLTCQWYFLQLEQRWNLVKPSPWRKASSSPGLRTSCHWLNQSSKSEYMFHSFIFHATILSTVANCYLASWVNSPR